MRELDDIGLNPLRLSRESENLNMMNVYIWRHSKAYSSWSMMDEPNIFQGNYIQAAAVVIAGSETEALQLLREEGRWNIDELVEMEPQVLPVDKPAVVGGFIC